MNIDTDQITERRAKFVYDGARIAAEAALAPIVPEPWDDREAPFKEQFRVVIRNQCGPNRCDSPEQLHEEWVIAYKEMGWRFGPERNVEEKTHPDMVPYWQLGQLERDKDDVFVMLCEIARLFIREDG